MVGSRTKPFDYFDKLAHHKDEQFTSGMPGQHPDPGYVGTIHSLK